MLYFNISHFILLIFTLCSAQYIYADENSRKNSSNQDDVSEGTRSPSQPTQELEASSPIKPTIILIVAVLAVLLFIILLLLLYAKNCKLGAGHSNLTIGGVVTPQVDRKSSGIERVVVESLPLFRFRSLRGQKDGLECAVCLNRFEATEILRLLPKCKHAFHVECVDTWLDAHSTCPLCRYRVDKKDILLIEDNNNNNNRQGQEQEQQESSQDVVLSIDPNPVVVDQCQRRHLSVEEAELGNRIMSKSNRWRTDQSISLDDSGNNKKKKKKNESWLTSSSSSSRRRVEHRILVSDCDWQQKQECDLVLVRQDMLLTTRDTRLVDKEVSQRSLTMNINKRSLSELTSLSRFPSIRVASGISSSKSTNCSSCNQNFNIVSQN